MDGAGQKALCALRVTDLPPPSTHPAERTPGSPLQGWGSSRSPIAARPLAAGSAARVRIGSRDTWSLRGTAPGTGSRLTWVFCVPGPSPCQADPLAQRGPRTPPGRSSAWGRRAGNALAKAAWSRAAQRPAHLGPAPPGPAVLTAAWLREAQNPTHLEPSSEPIAPSDRRISLIPRPRPACSTPPQAPPLLPHSGQASKFQSGPCSPSRARHPSGTRPCSSHPLASADLGPARLLFLLRSRHVVASTPPLPHPHPVSAQPSG